MKPSKRLWRTLLFLVLLAALCGSFAFPVVNVPVSAAPQMQAATNIVISEFRTRGASGGNDEFVEVFNPTTNPIDIGGWLIRVSNSSATGTPSNRYTFPPGTILQPGQHFIAIGTNYSGNVQESPVAALSGTGITDDGGIAITLPDGITIIDQVGMSAGSIYGEGTRLSPLTTNVNRSYERNLEGAGSCIDSNSNNPDFFVRNPSDPQNSLSTVTTCGNPTQTPSPTSSPTSTNTPTLTATSASPRSVIINEVAWSGTTAADTHEWFELYNNTGAAINLNGWQLESEDGIPTINLSGTIAAGDYFVAARSATTFNDLTADLIYSGNPFQNNPDAEILYLVDPNGNQVDTANLDGGAWNAGLGSPTYASMERQGTSPDSPTAWTTYGGTVPVAHDRQGNNIKGTPGQANWINTVTATPTASATGTATATGTRTNTASPTGYLSVLINEVAWMGTGAASEDEWIELYNPGTNTVDLAGWLLKADDTSPNIVFPPGASIAPKGFYLLERTDDTTVIDVTADLIYTGELNNSFEILRLFDASSRLIDTANVNGGNWPAGITSSTTHGTMERRGVVADSDSAWITNVNPATWTKHDSRGTSSTSFLIHGTPKSANWAVSVTPTPSRVPTVIVVRTPTRIFTPLPPPPLVVINEFVPRPGHDWNLDGVVNVEDEYVELLNHGVVDVNLGGYSLDDEVNIGSAPYRLPAVVVRPGERIVFYGSETGLLLGDGGDGVRLLKPNGQLMDAYNYFIVGYPDQSYCRLPDNGGADDWNKNCFPTPGLQNSLGGTSSPPRGGAIELFCPIADTLPDEFAWAECEPYGHNIWRAAFWDRTGWYDEKYLPGTNGKWPVFAD